MIKIKKGKKRKKVNYQRKKRNLLRQSGDRHDHGSLGPVNSKG